MTVRRDMGDICLSGALDYESADTLEFNVTATDQGRSHCTVFINCVIYLLSYLLIWPPGDLMMFYCCLLFVFLFVSFWQFAALYL